MASEQRYTSAGSPGRLGGWIREIWREAQEYGFASQPRVARAHACALQLALDWQDGEATEAEALAAANAYAATVRAAWRRLPRLGAGAWKDRRMTWEAHLKREGKPAPIGAPRGDR